METYTFSMTPPQHLCDLFPPQSVTCSHLIIFLILQVVVALDPDRCHKEDAA